MEYNNKNISVVSKTLESQLELIKLRYDDALSKEITNKQRKELWLAEIKELVKLLTETSKIVEDMEVEG